MVTVMVRKLDESVRDRLKIRAAVNGRSMEAEIRDILEEAVRPVDVPEKGFGTWMRKQFEDAGLVGLELDIPARTGLPRYVDFSKDGNYVVRQMTEADFGEGADSDSRDDDAEPTADRTSLLPREPQ